MFGHGGQQDWQICRLLLRMRGAFNEKRCRYLHENATLLQPCLKSTLYLITAYDAFDDGFWSLLRLRQRLCRTWRGRACMYLNRCLWLIAGAYEIAILCNCFDGRCPHAVIDASAAERPFVPKKHTGLEGAENAQWKYCVMTTNPY